MKKFLSALFCATMVFSLTACGSPASGNSSASASSNTQSTATLSEASSTSSSNVPNSSSILGSSEVSVRTPIKSDGAVPTKGSKTLVVYFSMPETSKTDNLTTDEENSVVVIDGKVLGNTQYIANVIQENTGADIFRIEPQTPYPTDHDALVNLAKEEQNKKARPAMSANVENLSGYDTIFIGYPNWWGDMPMILYTFFEQNDLSGKTIIPFNTHGGSGFSSTIDTIAKLEPNATVNENGFTVSRNDVHNAAADVINWLEKLEH